MRYLLIKKQGEFTMSNKNEKKMSDIKSFQETGDNNQLNQNINNMNKRDQRVKKTENQQY